ncbi:unnamed protein product [Somion occarium]|uniref:MYND-type domain-containing protein n=2 Tax=Somion occarium TaxID=3059160 RepID=A0ABP1DXJ5_9APHY
MDAIKPLERPPCANINGSQNTNCSNDATSTCSRCLLVMYCSPTCQAEHWSTHKKDCKHKLRDQRWTLSNTPPGAERVTVPRSGNGQSLWKQVPAMDVLNVNDNEKSQGYALAFADTEFENLVLSINGLPKDYSGKLTILLNHESARRAAQNLALLLLLASQGSVTEAAEAALHLWFSSFVQPASTQALTSTLQGVIEQSNSGDHFSQELHENAFISGVLSKDALQILSTLGDLGYTTDEARDQRNRVFFNPEETTHRLKQYGHLDPSHRLALEHFRGTGVVLPFGSSTSTFSAINPFLFATADANDEVWVQNDAVSPLEAWKPTVVTVGQDYGCKREDIYGCLYFYLLDQLRTLATRLRSFNVQMHFYDRDGMKLCKDIQSGALADLGVPSDLHFDRIDLSTILDTVDNDRRQELITTWGGLIKDSDQRATMLGWTRFWVMHVPDATAPQNPDPRRPDPHISNMFSKLWEKNWVPRTIVVDPVIITGTFAVLDCVYDNSGPFVNYLQKSGTYAAAEKAKLRVRDVHSVVPQRLYVAVGSPYNALPDFATPDDFYLSLRLTCDAIGESSVRWMEFGRT